MATSKTSNGSGTIIEDNYQKRIEDTTILDTSNTSTTTPSPSHHIVTSNSPYTTPSGKNIRKEDEKLTKTPKTPKNKKTNLRKKIENKRNPPDIRKFWKTLGNNGDNDISRQEEDTINVKEDKTNLRKKDDPGK